MGTIKYNKLVRERIPDIIEKSGKACVTEILSDEEYLCMVEQSWTRNWLNTTRTRISKNWQI